MVTCGLAFRFRYHIGFLAARPCDATSTTRSPSRQNSSGLTRASPVLRPIVVSNATGAPCRNFPPTFPPVRLYSDAVIRDIHLMMNLVYGASRPRGRSAGIEL